MLDLDIFLAEPESAATFVQELKTGTITMNWKEILADNAKVENLQELTFGLMMQAADNAELLEREKLTAVLGKIFILNRELEVATAQEETMEKLTTLCNNFETAIREFAGLINTQAAVESIHALQENDETDLLSADLYTECPLFTLIFGLHMLVHAHEIIEFDDHEDNQALFDTKTTNECEL